MTSTSLTPLRRYHKCRSHIFFNQKFKTACSTTRSTLCADWRTLGFVVSKSGLQDDRGCRKYSMISIDIYGITTARYTGPVKVDLQIWGLREHFQSFNQIKGVSELTIAKAHVKRPQQATKFDFQAVSADICLEVGTMVIEVKMGKNTEFGLLPTR